jgi:hypothetical protein
MKKKFIRAQRFEKPFRKAIFCCSAVGKIDKFDTFMVFGPCGWQLQSQVTRVTVTGPYRPEEAGFEIWRSSRASLARPRRTRNVLRSQGRSPEVGAGFCDRSLTSQSSYDNTISLTCNRVGQLDHVQFGLRAAIKGCELEPQVQVPAMHAR